jgi:hypothetical protein
MPKKTDMNAPDAGFPLNNTTNTAAIPAGIMQIDEREQFRRKAINIGRNGTFLSVPVEFLILPDLWIQSPVFTV